MGRFNLGRDTNSAGYSLGGRLLLSGVECPVAGEHDGDLDGGGYGVFFLL